ncbi:unnamed protein product [Oikopleura dioica]|uniref:DNA-directed DNA polymerase n=1 Tax=Oikopleura dioica TaxID=34765 RepID=E4XJG5_OIKDI|nr:unnamed protein product [Oikopleura dioica]
MCSRKSPIISVQTSYGQRTDIIFELVKHKFLPSEALEYRKTTFLTFDIETFERESKETTASTVMHASHHILSIAIGSNCGYEKVIIREDDSPEAAKKIVAEFVRELQMQIETMRCLPDYFYKTAEKLQEKIDSMEKSPKRSKFQQLLRKLEQYLKVDVFGFNSAKFDIPVLAPYLLPQLQEHCGKLSVIKKGTSFFLVETDICSFKDVLNLTTPINLSGYLKQNRIAEEKGIWPYSLYRSVAEIKKCEDFPAYEEFYSELKQQNIPRELYDENRKIFNVKKWKNPEYTMVDWLKQYNLLDCNPLAHAIDRAFGNFQKVFKMDPSMSLSLPGFAQNCMFSHYNESSSLAHSFHGRNDEIRDLFRKNIVGGLVNCFSRYTELDDIEAPYNAKYTKSGEQFTKITFLDFNALYLWSQNQKLPTTPGILWERHGNSFRKNIMTTGNSYAALQWLLFAQENDPNLIDKNGDRQQLQRLES